MADYSRRRRKGSSSSDNFNWEEYDRLTSKVSAASGSAQNAGNVNTPDEAVPSRRRAQQAATAKKRTRAVKQEKIRKRNKNKGVRKKIGIAFVAVMAVCAIIVTGIAIGMYAAVSREIKDMNIRNLALNYSSFIYYQDVNGNTKEYEQIRSVSNRIMVESKDISPYFKEAMVSIEDERFYNHTAGY